MKKLFFYLFTSAVCISAIPNEAIAQFDIPEKSLCEQLKLRTLIVELRDDSSGADEVMRNAFKDYWIFSKVEFLHHEEFTKILVSGDTRYAALLAFEDESKHTINRWDTKNGSFRDLKTFTFSHFDFGIDLITGSKTNTNVCTITLANKNIVTGDLLFVVQQMSHLINASLNDIKGLAYYDHKKNIEFVKTKTLLIPKELFKEKELLKIKGKYDFPYRIVTLAEMNDLVLTKNEEYIYPKIIFCKQLNAFGWVTINAKDGSVTSIMAFGGFYVSSNVKSDELLKVGHLKYIVSSMAQGINNKYK